MRPFICTRFHRRFIVKYFGSLSNLILWTLCVSLTVYFLDNYFFKINTNDTTKDINISKETVSADQKKENAAKNLCGIEVTCSSGEYAYHIRSGVGKESQPIICFNGLEVFSVSKANGKRGINMAIINDKTKQIEDIRTFDTYEDDNILLRYLQLGIEKNHLLMIASLDEASLHLTLESKTLLASFGSELISKLEFRDNFVMVGQKGLVSPAKAIEQLVTRKSGESHAGVAEIKGCLSIPLGTTLKEPEAVPAKVGAPVPEAHKVPVSNVKLGAVSPNCEVSTPCGADHYAVRLYTGLENTKLPKICFNGHYVLDDNLNEPTRGMNVMVYDDASGVVTKIAHFDTYTSIDQSVAFGNFLIGVEAGEVVMVVAHDEVQTNLKKGAMDLLENFGSSFISGIAFRDVWVFVGRKDMKGFSPYEDIESGSKEAWPFAIDKRVCVKKNFEPLKEKIDLSLFKNLERRNFCKKYDGYEDFCSADVIDVHPLPVVQNIQSMKDNIIYKVPIIIVPGLSHVSTLMQFQALLKVPGIDSKMITVMYDQKFEESGILARLFNFPTLQLESTTKYVYLIEKALEKVWEKFDTAEYVIMMEEEIIPSPDFLYFFSQVLPQLTQDDTLVGISAFNENGFEGVSSKTNLAYRGRTFPGFGFLLKKSFYVDQMKGKIRNCCIKRAWYSWFFEGLGKKEMIYPEVSRVSRRQFLGLTENAALIREYFNRPRVTSKGDFEKISNALTLPDDKYTENMNEMLKTSVAFPISLLSSCLSSSSAVISIDIPQEKGTGYAIYFEQENEFDENLFSLLCKCFGLFHSTDSKLKGIHKNSLRFTFKDNTFFLIGQFSIYFKHMPKDYKPLTKGMNKNL